jgi:hypothetical protein
MRDRTVIFFACVPLALALTAFETSCVGDDPEVSSPNGDAGGNGNGNGEGSVGAEDTGPGTDVDSSADVIATSDIDGHVTDLFARPVPGATVRVGAVIVNSDTSGHFHLTGVPATYDLDVVAPSKTNGKGVTSFRGLTTRNPEVTVEGEHVSRTAAVSGTFMPTVSLGANEHVRVTDVDTMTGFDHQAISTNETGAWSGTAMWAGPTTSPLTFWMWKYGAIGSEGEPTAFFGYATVRRNAVAGMGDNSLSSGLTAVTTASLSGSVTDIPSPASSALVFIVMKHSLDRYGHTLSPKLGVNGAFTMATPSGTGLSVNVIAQTGANVGPLSENHFVWKANAASNATGVTLAFGTPARPVSPAPSATGVKNDAIFDWSAGSPAGVYELVIRCGSGASEYVATVYTTAKTAAPSDAGMIGAPWPASTSCNWGVTLFQKITTVDAVVAVAGARNELEKGNGPKDGAFVRSFGYGFMTP